MTMTLAVSMVTRQMAPFFSSAFRALSVGMSKVINSINPGGKYQLKDTCLKFPKLMVCHSEVSCRRQFYEPE